MTGCITPAGEDLPCAEPLPRAPAGGSRGHRVRDGSFGDPHGYERNAFRTG